MHIPERDVWMLVLANGTCPIEEWLTRGIRDSATRARISHRIDKLQRGVFGDWKSVGSGVQELRIDAGPGYRVYYARQGSKVIVLIDGGDKGTQSSDIGRAEQLWREFLQTGSAKGLLRRWPARETSVSPMRLKSFDEYLFTQLQDPEFATAYLEDALADGVDEFLVALRKYVQANGGMSRTAGSAKVAREAMYRMLSANGNPGIRQIEAILASHGLQLHVA